MAGAKDLFLRGSFQEICARFVDSSVTKCRGADVPWVVGGLVFLGRVGEAVLFWESHGRGLGEEERIVGGFFLGIGEARASSYIAARRIFAENLLRLRALERNGRANGRLHALRFFAWQGVSFLRQMGCRYGLALASSQRAFDAAFLWGDPFARTLAADHRGHMLVRVGMVSEGLKLLAWAQDFAEKNGFVAISQAIGVARLNYEAQHGRSPREDLERLEAHFRTLASEDCYSRASAAVELARQLLLRGRGREAGRHLDEAEPFLEAHGQRRQKCGLWLRRASLEFWEGRFDAALTCLERAESVLVPEWDLVFLLEVLGLRLRCLAELGRPPDERLAERVEALTRKTGSRIARQILLRRKGLSGTDDDPLGALLDRVETEFRAGKSRRSAQEAISDVLAAQYLLLLPRVLGFRPGARAVVLDLTPGSVLVVDGANIHFCPMGATAQIRGLLLALARQPLTRKELVEWIWGYRYQPDRHDSLVYALVRRARRLLGANEEWIASRGGQYGLEDGVEVRVHEPGMARHEEPVAHPSAEKSGASHWERDEAARPPLNHRQVLFLEWLTEHRFAGVREVQSAFGISKATANRDLAELLASGLVVRRGRARQTRYEAVARDGIREPRGDPTP